MKELSWSLTDALRTTLEHVQPLGVETIALADSTDRIAASDLPALVDSPSADSSLKDGYAVVSREIDNATPEHPVRLKLAGRMSPGGIMTVGVRPGTTVRVLTGARIPPGADAVLTEEFTRREGDEILAVNSAGPGRNILRRGSDVESGICIIGKGRQIAPGLLGLIAAAGHSTLPVFRTPTVAIIGTGDEIVLPGEPLAEGRLYASNILTINAWCRRYGMKTILSVVHDDIGTLTETFRRMSAGADALVTSGGAWTGDRDFTAQVLDGLGWHQYFHRIRIGPGKAVGFGMLGTKPVFILPGGPSSNLMGFLQIALPGLLALGGYADPGLPRINARLGEDLEGRQRDWTNFFFGRLEKGNDFPVFHALRDSSRLRSIAESDAIACIPEGQGVLAKGTLVPVQLLK